MLVRLGIHRGPNPHFLEKRVSGSQNPHFPSFWKREFSAKNSPFLYKGTHRKWGFLDRKLPFPAFVRARGYGGFGPRNPLFQEIIDSGSNDGIPKKQHVICQEGVTSVGSRVQEASTQVAFHTIRQPAAWILAF